MTLAARAPSCAPGSNDCVQCGRYPGDMRSIDAASQPSSDHHREPHRGIGRHRVARAMASRPKIRLSFRRRTTSSRLRPHALIAKVGRWRHSADSLIREHAVATALTADDAPVARPWPGIPPTRDVETGFMVTLWQRIDFDPERVVTPNEVGESLRELHEALARYDGNLPSPGQLGLGESGPRRRRADEVVARS